MYVGLALAINICSCNVSYVFDHAQQKEFIPDDYLMEISEIDSLVTDNSYKLPLYSGSNLMVLDAVAQHFEWFTDHPGTSKEALSSMLHMQHNKILPEGNLLPDSYAAACRMIEPFLARKETYHVCPNHCVLFRNEFANMTACPKCNTSRYKHGVTPERKFTYLPLGPRLSRMFHNKNLAEIIQAHISIQNTASFMHDIHDSPTWKSAYSTNGIFKGDPRGLSLAFCTDGVNPFSHNRIAYSMWPIMLTLLNLPREIRNDFGSILLLGIIPGNGSQEPKNLDPYLEVFIDELLQLSGSTLFDAYQSAPFQLKVDVLLYVLDNPGLGKVLNMSGSGAYKGCMWCDIKGTHIKLYCIMHDSSYCIAQNLMG